MRKRCRTNVLTVTMTTRVTIASARVLVTLYPRRPMESDAQKILEMNECEFIGHASGRTYSDALNNRIRPATPDVVAAIQRLEEVKHAVREQVREAFPATRSWHYETSWQYNDEAL